MLDWLDLWQLVRLGHSRGVDMISLLLEIVQATLTISVLLMQWREGATQLAFGHVCSHVTLTALLVCKICVGTPTDMIGDATIKMLIEYGFFVFVISSGVLANDWFYSLVEKCVPPLRCLAGVAQILHTRNAQSTGALSGLAVLLQFLAAALRQSTGVESGSVGGGELYNLLGEWPLNATLARLYLVVQMLWYWGEPMPPLPEHSARRQKAS